MVSVKEERLGYPAVLLEYVAITVLNDLFVIGLVPLGLIEGYKCIDAPLYELRLAFIRHYIHLS